MVPCRAAYWFFVVVSLIAAECLTAQPVVAAESRVQLELVGEGGGAALAYQDWLKTLSAAGIRNVRIRGARPSDKVGIETRDTGVSPTYVVTGIVRGRDELILPIGRVRTRDVGRLAAWLDELARFGPADRREKKGAFGLSAAAYEHLREALSRPVAFATEGQTRTEVVRRIAQDLSVPLKADPASANVLSADKVQENLMLLSSGTALACVLRPAGYCLVPRQQGGQLVCDVVAAKPGLDIWPVGWEPGEARRDLLPALFEFHNINIQGVAADKALAAIAKRLEVPVLWDHNALARHGIDPTKAMVNHPRGKTTYSLALRKLLFQAGLKAELRVDEAGRPFLWITSVKPV